jgi:translocation and assembly module TamB
MRKLLILICALVGLAFPAMAQEDDRGLIIGFLEDNLSDAGREIRLEGFEGALSSQATLERLTIADEDDIWFELENAQLDWTRSALLAGRLEVDRLSAEAITLHRLPGGDRLGPDDTEAREFNLPDLPVSIDIATLEVETLSLAAPVLGEAAEFQFAGAVALNDGEGSAQLAIERLDAPADLTLEASFDNASRQLAIDFAVNEAKNGFLSRMIGLPGQPAIAFSLAGRGPLDDFNADLTLASDGADRLTGTLTTMRDPDAEKRQFNADLSGDLRPLFQPDLRAFFGQETSLNLRATRAADGALSISRFRLQSAAMNLRGAARIAANGWPERVSLEGRIGGADGPTRLPVAGPPTQLQSAEISASYDQARGEAWQADITVERLENGPLDVDRAEISARGTLSRDAPLALEADLKAALSGLTHKDESLARALGTQAEAKARLSWREGQPLTISGLSVKADDLTLNGAGQVGGAEGGLPVSASLRLDAPSLDRFAPLANLPLSGAAGMTITGNADLLSGAFDGALFAETADLSLGNPMLDPLIAGQGTLRLSALRDTNGIAFDRLDLKTPEAEIRAIGRLNSDSGTLKLNADIRDLARTDLKLSGPAQLDTAIEWQDDAPLRLTNLHATLADSTLTATGTLDPEDEALPLSGTARLEARDLARFSGLARRPLRGAATLSLNGQGSLRDQTFEVTTEAEAKGLRTAIPTVDALLTSGPLSLSGEIAKANGIFDLRQLSLKTPGLTLQAEGRGPGAPIDMDARISDLARLAPGFPGPLSARGTVQLLDAWGRQLSLNLSADGPGGTQANVSGSVRDYGQSVDMTANGTAPLGLANRFISPRAIQGTARYDLRINGAPQLASVSGEVSTSGARATLPTYGVVIQNIDARAALASGRANLQVQAQSRAGGSLRVDGPIRPLGRGGLRHRRPHRTCGIRSRQSCFLRLPRLARLVPRCESW